MEQLLKRPDIAPAPPVYPTVGEVETAVEIKRELKSPLKRLHLTDAFTFDIKDPKGFSTPKVFEPALTEMDTIARSAHIALPSREELEKRVIVVDREMLINLELMHLPLSVVKTQLETRSLPLGVTLPNGLAVVNFSEISGRYFLDKSDKEFKKQKKLRNDHVREQGVLQLWTSLSHRSGISNEPMRNGLSLQYPGLDPYISHGLEILNQQTLMYLTQKTIANAGFKPRKVYHLETDIVDDLVTCIGEEPFIQALLLSEGLQQLHDALEGNEELRNKFGDNVLWNISRAYGQPLKLGSPEQTDEDISETTQEEIVMFEQYLTPEKVLPQSYQQR